MDSMKKHWVKVKEVLEISDHKEVSNLEALCIKTDQTMLKLELDYKYQSGLNIEGLPNRFNEFMYYIGETLVGYIGIGCFGGTTAELNGMVHPGYRRQGIFKKLSELAIDECRRQAFTEVLLLCDRKSESGQSFVKKLSTKLHHSEYEMDLNDHYIVENTGSIQLVKATNENAEEIGRQNAIYFGQEYDPAHLVMPEEEERRGMTVYLAMLEHQVIGKTHLQCIDGVGGIYGLGIMPDYRGKGYGRALLNASVEKLKSLAPHRIMLQVEVKNEKALQLYQSCGFVTQSTMAYYSWNKQ